MGEPAGVLLATMGVVYRQRWVEQEPGVSFEHIRLFSAPKWLRNVAVGVSPPIGSAHTHVSRVAAMEEEPREPPRSPLRGFVFQRQHLTTG